MISSIVFVCIDIFFDQFMLIVFDVCAGRVGHIVFWLVVGTSVCTSIVSIHFVHEIVRKRQLAKKLLKFPN